MLKKSLAQSRWKDKKKNMKFYKKRVKSLKLPAFHPCLPSDFLCQTSRLSAVFPQNLIHLFKLLFHLLHQTELGSGPHQIVLRISRLKIYISLKIICQETHSALQCHQPCSPGQTVNFRRSQHVPCHFQITLYIKLIQMKVKIILIEILRVLLCCRRAKTNGISEIIGYKICHIRNFYSFFLLEYFFAILFHCVYGVLEYVYTLYYKSENKSA